MADAVRTLCQMSLHHTVLFAIALSNYILCRMFAQATTIIPIDTKTVLPRIKESLLKFSVIPDIIPDSGYPKEEIQVVWPKAKADLGNHIRAEYTTNAPSLSWKASKGDIFTLLMIDPDQNQNIEVEDREYLHWLIGNIPENNVAEGQNITDYIPATKPRPLEIRRYVFFVFKHSDKKKITFTEPRLVSYSDERRGSFRTTKFMEKYGFENVYAVNFFHGEWDAWAPPEDESDIYVTETNRVLNTTAMHTR